MITIKWRSDLMAIDIPLPDFVVTSRYEVLRVNGREANIPCSVLLTNYIVALPSLDVPQMDCMIIRS